MARRRERDDERAREEASAARDFTMARLAACRAYLADASKDLDEALENFVQPDSDRSGKKRAELLERIDDEIGLAAIAVQAAQGGLEDVDPAEGEPDLEDDEPEDDRE